MAQHQRCAIASTGRLNFATRRTYHHMTVGQVVFGVGVLACRHPLRGTEDALLLQLVILKIQTQLCPELVMVNSAVSVSFVRNGCAAFCMNEWLSYRQWVLVHLCVQHANPVTFQI